ncbi:MAG: hypothetical protein MJA29_13070 [Candidatus Omnitrophica bacterium]|nr:hypothetical protein [Candidatus Omnitrophota bacterium]
MDTWQHVLLEPARSVFAQIGSFLISILLVVFILIVGWVVSKTVRTVVTKGLRLLKLDELSDRIELDNLLEKGGIGYSLSELVGLLSYWVCLLVTLIVAVNAVGLTIAADLLNKVVLYVPNVVAAIVILILGMFVATLLKNIVQTAANNAGFTQGAFLSKLVEIIIIAFVVFIALEQLNIGIRVTELTLAIILGSVGLGCALAFGLGCKEQAGKFVEELINKMKSGK